jgi:hypothetical protein
MNLRCHCGYFLSDSGDPNDRLHVVRDRDMSEYMRHISRVWRIQEERGDMLPPLGSRESDDFHESLNASVEMTGEMWECPKCGRLLWRRPGERTFKTFRPEDGDANPPPA